MELNRSQIEQYKADGFLLLPDQFTGTEMEMLQGEVDKVLAGDVPEKILEKSGAVRSCFSPETRSPLFRRLTRLKRLLGPARQLLENEVYIHQTKINSKKAMVGDWWEWHQDFPYWYREDGMQQPWVLTAMVFLNEVNEFNGPMLLIPGSHQAGIADVVNADEAAAGESEWFAAYQRSTPYMSALTSSLKYALDKSMVAAWAVKNGIVSAKGPAGSVLFFHGNIFHASANNLSPWDRNAFLITYNSVANELRQVDNPRPGFLANRNFEPLAFLPEDQLLDRFDAAPTAKP